MKIVVLDIAASSGGALSILKDFYSYLVKSGDENEWIFILSDNYLPETKNIKVHICDEVKKNWGQRLKFDFFTGRKYINSFNADVVISLQNTIPYGINAKKYIYVHQTLPFQSVKKFSFLKSAERIYAIYQHIIGKMIINSIKRADYIVVQTEWLKKTINQLGIAEEKILKCTPTIETIDCEDIPFDNKYFFYPAAPIIYKNHEVIREAQDILFQQGFSDFMVEFTMEGEPEKNIIPIGTIERKKVFEKYARGTLIFPSYIESYGYPLAEARLMNAVILASKCAFSKELLQGYANAYYFDPFAPEELAQLMQKVLCGEIVRKDQEQEWVAVATGWSVLFGHIVGGNE